MPSLEEIARMRAVCAEWGVLEPPPRKPHDPNMPVSWAERMCSSADDPPPLVLADHPRPSSAHLLAPAEVPAPESPEVIHIKPPRSVDQVVDLGNCPTCDRPYGERRRCYYCQPARPRKAAPVEDLPHPAAPAEEPAPVVVTLDPVPEPRPVVEPEPKPEAFTAPMGLPESWIDRPRVVRTGHVRGLGPVQAHPAPRAVTPDSYPSFASAYRESRSPALEEAEAACRVIKTLLGFSPEAVDRIFNFATHALHAEAEARKAV